MTGLLRQRLNFNGVAMTDDLDMQAVSSLIPRWEAVIKAIRAGNDLLMIRNVSDFDPELPRKVVAWGSNHRRNSLARSNRLHRNSKPGR